MESTNNLLDFTKKLEKKKIVNTESGAKIRDYIRKIESPTNWQIFLVIGGVFGALFASAGVYALISHNWYDYPKHLKGLFGLFPVGVALYFYYLAVFKHRSSKAWVEASSLFLMLMIGASIAIVSQTYQMDGDFNNFIKVWLVLSVPLFYFAKASFISMFYLILSCLLLVRIRFGFFFIPEFSASNDLTWFWMAILAFIPHYYLAINRDSKRQSIRVIFMSYFLYIVIVAGLAVSIEGNYLLWFAVVQAGFYLFGKRYMSENQFVLARPFQWITSAFMVYFLILLSNEFIQYEAFRMDSIFDMDDWEGGQWYYFCLLLVVMAGVYFNYFRDKASFGNVNALIVYAPAFLLFAMVLDNYTTSWWWMAIYFNAYILILGITTIVHGNTKGDVIKMVAGLIVIAVLLWVRYFDNDLSFITRGIVFLIVGGMFFVINLLVKDKVEDIQRHKTLSDEK